MKDLVKEIKRTKKPKNTKPAHDVHIHDSRSLSPPSLTSSDNQTTIHSPPSTPTKSNGLGWPDQGWLESEFSYLKRQNMYLEQQLATQNKALSSIQHMLVQLTLQVAPTSLEGANVGEKRRRTSPFGSSNAYCEEQKLFDGDDYEPYGDRKLPPPATNSYEFGHTRDDSLKRFVDIMLNDDDEQEECKVIDVHDRAVAATIDMNGPNNSNAAKSPPESNEDALDDELLEEAMNSVLPGASVDIDGDLFGFAGNDEVAYTRSSSIPAAQPQANGQLTPLVTMANASVDKTDGPQPIRSISSDLPEVQGDIEENTGVTIVAAHAELVQEEVPSNNASNEVSQHDWRFKRRVVCLLAFIVASIVVIGITWPAVAVTKKNKYKAHIPKYKGRNPKGTSHSADSLRPCRPGEGRGLRHNGCLHPSSSEDRSPGWAFKQSAEENDDQDRSENLENVQDQANILVDTLVVDDQYENKPQNATQAPVEILTDTVVGDDDLSQNTKQDEFDKRENDAKGNVEFENLENATQYEADKPDNTQVSFISERSGKNLFDKERPPIRIELEGTKFICLKDIV